MVAGDTLSSAGEEERMPARQVASGTISFGLVSIPVRLFVATHSEQRSFNLLHRECGSRIRQQVTCPRCERTVERSELVRGFEFAKDRYVTFTDEELKSLEAAASKAIEIQEFVPLAKVDPLYFENSHYLGPDKGAEKAYQLLAEAMRETRQVALAQWVNRGKEQLVLIRPVAEGLVLHALYYGDEVRPFSEVERGETVRARPAEVDLARQLVAQLSATDFTPDRYRDHYRDRLDEVVQKKIAGEEVTAAAPEPAPAQVIDLMEALKRSLAGEARRAGPGRVAAARRPRTAAQAGGRARARRR
jgi:DNA end-binding protein Ku